MHIYYTTIYTISCLCPVAQRMMTHGPSLEGHDDPIIEAIPIESDNPDLTCSELLTFNDCFTYSKKSRTHPVHTRHPGGRVFRCPELSSQSDLHRSAKKRTPFYRPSLCCWEMLDNQPKLSGGLNDSLETQTIEQAPLDPTPLFPLQLLGSRRWRGACWPALCPGALYSSDHESKTRRGEGGSNIVLNTSGSNPPLTRSKNVVLSHCPQPKR